MPEGPTELLSEVELLDTCAVSDALDRLGLAGAVTGVTSMSVTGPATVAGWAVTTAVTANPPPGEAPHVGTLAVGRAGADDVIVMSAGGGTAVSAWGGILSCAAAAAGVRAVVVDGACRDIGDARSLGFPVFARAVVPVSARGRLWHRCVQEPVSVGGVTVAPGDLVVADANGVVFVPLHRAGEVVALAARIAAAERRIVERVRAGEALSAVMTDPAPADR
ncbi:MAG TPA: 4-carboxy-4-hydroxy-2-oxoadipate aldolase/oxaloacetate decarboxylase [Micromonosporaceae bacterium]|nr:4-carboxy-4-hydroxy-2-oxoadipate aldolase/oxaloacetate decarboxylase [Micromonosporaceae bacterium]